MVSLDNNETWYLVNLLERNNPIDNNCLFQNKINIESEVEKFKALTVVEGITFSELFYHIANSTSITFIFPSLFFNLVVENMYLNTLFLHGDLEN